MYLLIMSSFLFDSYFKYTYLPQESDKLRAKYQDLQDFLYRSFGGFILPLPSDLVSANSQLIVSVFAALQATCSVLVLIGKRGFAWMLIVLTVVHMIVMHNPNYKNTTEIDKQRAYKHICGDLSLIAILIMCTGFKRQPRLKVKLT